MITYKHACPKDIPGIIDFLKENWRSNHIIIRRPDVFMHFYLEKNKNPNYFLAFNEEDKIIGTLGYITNKMFSKDVVGNGAWLSMWCVVSGLREPVGFNLLKTLEDKLNVDFISTLGAGYKTLPYYNKLGYVTGAAEHWKCNLKNNLTLDSNWLISDNLSLKKIKNNSLGKNIEYLKNKFIKKKYYEYLTFSVFYNNELVTSIVGRIINYSVKKIKIFRVVDFTGDIDGISGLVTYLANNKKYKHIDFVDIIVAFIGQSKSLSSVFNKCSENDYLPLYFEPLITEYKQKYFVYKANNSKFRKNLIVTGDCDQDRPSK